ncbi:MAG: SGNH/GDSL hydrolase family protein [Desulfobaccales bacterium]
MLREIGKNTILFFLGLLVALAIVEVVLRIYNPLGFTMKGNKILLPVNRIQIIHNLKGGKLDELVVNKKNSLGFRGEDPPADFKAWLTIVTVGGSTTECLAINEEKSWPHLLQEKLKNHFSKLWLNNAGIGGHSTFAHIILMKDFLIKLKPKVVLFLAGINDLGRSDISNSDRNLWGFGFQKFETMLMVGANHSEVVSILLNLYRFYFPAYTKLSQIDERDIRTLKPKEIPAAEEEPIIEKYRQNYLPDYRLRLEKLINLARANQIDPVLITQPALYGNAVDDITGVHLDDIDVYGVTNGKTGWRELELYNEVTRQVGKEREVLVFDLARELPKSSLYYYDLVHYSNEGCARVAEIIYSHLLPYLAKKYPNYYRGLDRH